MRSGLVESRPRSTKPERTRRGICPKCPDTRTELVAKDLGRRSLNQSRTHSASHRRRLEVADVTLTRPYFTGECQAACIIGICSGMRAHTAALNQAGR